ncbi:sensor histidine kinase [Rhizobium sp. 9140]|uniref:sensor histidine kinase n=1 Tax=Rhizobium sp. 9140 TaxID=1761900 RepID=UPI00079C77D4|nr:HAMP domain-containing sensor histidine kinase [Rhizobium sp. 9140]CZT36753.1 Signal transduction histidine kinase [Rhizobium sp. 9140]
MKLPTLPSRSTISARLLIFSTLFVTAALIVAAVILWLIVAGVVREQIDQRLDTQIDALRGTLVVHPDGSLALGASLDGPPFDRIGSGWYWQVTGDGAPMTSRSLGSRTIDSPPRPIPGRHRPGADDPQKRVEAADDGGMDLHIRTVEARIGDRTLEISATAPQAALNDPARRALFWLVPAMAVLGVSLVLGTLLQVRYGLRPLKTLTQDIADVAEGSRETLPDVSAEELRPVANEINRLVAANLQRLADTRLHFANLAHGLKTPVASLSLALDDRNDPDGEMRRLVERIDERIRHHLARARKTMSGAGMGASTTLAASLADLVQILSRIHAERGLTVTCVVPEDIPVACATDDLDEILGNLIDNACKWARTSVVITAAIEGRMVVIGIEDDGPGIAEDRIANAFLPGIRMDETVHGDGFGLTIAREVAELYGGGIILANRPEGGLKVSLSLPRAVVRPSALTPCAGRVDG